jgi:adenine-specific DNA-methyltransferase
VARHFKQYARTLLACDLEPYSCVTNECYLANACDLDLEALACAHRELTERAGERLCEGFVAELYAPRDDQRILPGERVFFTRRNALYIDTVRAAIETLPLEQRKFFLAPLLAEASVHSNTSGVFKGFYKNKDTGIGQFGGTGRHALVRIKGDIALPFPVFSNFACESAVLLGDANAVVDTAPEVDLAYLDPPYNQHPYSSNYFMLNLILAGKRPQEVSPVSGIPTDWRRSAFNSRPQAFASLTRLVERVKAKFVLISFNSEGFVPQADMLSMLRKVGKCRVLETQYNAYRGSRNLRGRNIHVKEYLYLLEK